MDPSRTVARGEGALDVVGFGDHGPYGMIVQLPFDGMYLMIAILGPTSLVGFVIVFDKY